MLAPGQIVNTNECILAISNEVVLVIKEDSFFPFTVYRIEYLETKPKFYSGEKFSYLVSAIKSFVERSGSPIF